MRTHPPASFDDQHPGTDVYVKKPSGVAQRIGARVLHEAREGLPPTIFFFVGFNFIVFTTNLVLADYAIAVSNFMLATVAALVVGKAVLVASQRPYSASSDRLCMCFRINSPATSRVGRPGWPGPGVQTPAKRRSRNPQSISRASRISGCPTSLISYSVGRNKILLTVVPWSCHRVPQPR